MQQKKRLMIWRGSGVAPAPTLDNFFSLLFDGVDEYLTAPDSDAFSFTDGSGTDTSFSISMWVYPTANSGFPSMFSKAGASTREYVVYHNASAINFILYNATGGSWRIGITYTGALTLNTWSHLVFTYDGSEASSGMKMYVNGSALTTSTNDSGAYTGMANTTNPFIIGDYRFGSDFAGNIDETGIWKGTELSASQVTDLYNSGTPTDLSSFETTPGVWYRMGDGASFSTNWTIPNAMNPGTDDISSVNMEEADRVESVPS